jgi:flavin-dependent dehydrogenase
MPGYGWVFVQASNHLNIGVGTVTSGTKAKPAEAKALFNRWLPTLQERWGFTQEHLVDQPLGAALPMAFNRQPLYGGGLMLLGDAAGLVSPFTGEGIAAAMVSARIAAETITSALAQNRPDRRELALRAYPERLLAEYGGYYTLGRGFVTLIEHPKVMQLCTKYGLPRPTLMRLVNKMLSGMYEPHGGDWMDRLIALAARLAPADGLRSGGTR